MTETNEAYRGSPAILAIGQLALHRETLANFTDGRLDGPAERARTKNCTKNCGGGSSNSGTSGSGSIF